MLREGSVVLMNVQFADGQEYKTRPAVILFCELGNIIVAGITSNQKMKGIILTQKDGAIKKSVIKPNYIFTTTQQSIKKILFKLSTQKKNELYNALEERLLPLKT